MGTVSEFNGDFPQDFPELIQANVGEIEQFARVGPI
jgi:hypothetical protein